MKSLSKNPFFYLSLVLALLVGLQVYGIVAAQTAHYTPPTAVPTGGMPAQPLDTGTVPQVKKGNLAVSATGVLDANGKVSTGVQVNAGSETIWFYKGSDLARLYLVPANGGELWVAHGTGAGIKIGTGTGGGFGWTQSTTNPADIYNSNSGNVGIGVANPVAKLQVGGDILVATVPISQLVYQDQFRSLSRWTTKPDEKMSCDINDNTIDCFGNIPTSDAVGTVKYDNFTDQTTNEQKREVFQVTQITSTNGGKVTAADVDLSAPKWNGADVERELNNGGGTALRIMDMWIDRWSTCPDGYFVTGVRFGIRDGLYLTPVVRCNKL